MRLGARLHAPCSVVGLHSEPSFHVVELSDGSEIPARAVVIATGARYRRLPIAELGRFEGAGVYYAATDREAAVCARGRALVVGGGSAGQAAIYLSRTGCPVTIAIRGEELSRSMSRYLVDRIEANPAIREQSGVEVRTLCGTEHLGAATLVHSSGNEETIPMAGLFSFIGAEPAVAWLGAEVARDRNGFVLTDRDLDTGAQRGAPLPSETSVPGVFAAGDARSGSLKRVAAAVGEGSSAVRSVYARVKAAVR
jgi:thioredoxin reductase (NADPH)